MTIDIDGIKIESDDPTEALAIAHDIDALVNEQSEWDRYDGEPTEWRL